LSNIAIAEAVVAGLIVLFLGFLASQGWRQYKKAGAFRARKDPPRQRKAPKNPKIPPEVRPEINQEGKITLTLTEAQAEDLQAFVENPRLDDSELSIENVPSLVLSTRSKTTIQKGASLRLRKKAPPAQYFQVFIDEHRALTVSLKMDVTYYSFEEKTVEYENHKQNFPLLITLRQVNDSITIDVKLREDLFGLQTCISAAEFLVKFNGASKIDLRNRKGGPNYSLIPLPSTKQDESLNRSRELLDLLEKLRKLREANILEERPVPIALNDSDAEVIWDLYANYLDPAGDIRISGFWLSLQRPQISEILEHRDPTEGTQGVRFKQPDYIESIRFLRRTLTLYGRTQDVEAVKIHRPWWIRLQAMLPWIKTVRVYFIKAAPARRRYDRIKLT
jgi:hypothetical protein